LLEITYEKRLFREIFINEMKVQDNNYLNEFLSCLGEESENSDADGWVLLSRLKFELGL